MITFRQRDGGVKIVVRGPAFTAISTFEKAFVVAQAVGYIWTSGRVQWI